MTGAIKVVLTVLVLICVWGGWHIAQDGIEAHQQLAARDFATFKPVPMTGYKTYP